MRTSENAILLGAWVNKVEKKGRNATKARPPTCRWNLELTADHWCYQVAGIGRGRAASRAASGCFHISYASGHSPTTAAAPPT
jgi:hypothetical protein